MPVSDSTDDRELERLTEAALRSTSDARRFKQSTMTVLKRFNDYTGSTPGDLKECAVSLKSTCDTIYRLLHAFGGKGRSSIALLFNSPTSRTSDIRMLAQKWDSIRQVGLSSHLVAGIDNAALLPKDYDKLLWESRDQATNVANNSQRMCTCVIKGGLTNYNLCLMVRLPESSITDSCRE